MGYHAETQQNSIRSLLGCKLLGNCRWHQISSISIPDLLLVKLSTIKTSKLLFIMQQLEEVRFYIPVPGKQTVILLANNLATIFLNISTENLNSLSDWKELHNLHEVCAPFLWIGICHWFPLKSTIARSSLDMTSSVQIGYWKF